MERTEKNVRLGLTLPLGGADKAVELARTARDCGYEEIWTAEVNGGDSYALAGALAQGVPGMRIGTAVVPAQTRTPMVHAMAAMTLNQLTGGNFILGLGLSSPAIVHDWAGQPYDRPLTRMREHVEVLREILSGKKAGYEGETLSVRRFRLAGAVVGEVPIYIGALNKGMLRLTGALADGICLNMVPESALPQMLGEVRAGADDAGRDPSDHRSGRPASYRDDRRPGGGSQPDSHGFRRLRCDPRLQQVFSSGSASKTRPGRSATRSLRGTGPEWPKGSPTGFATRWPWSAIATR